MNPPIAPRPPSIRKLYNDHYSFFDKYRIKEVIEDGESRFYPQSKVFIFFWGDMCKGYGDIKTIVYPNIESAKNYLKTFIQETTKRIKYHKFEE